jgi:hypothetical protein
MGGGHRARFFFSCAFEFPSSHAAGGFNFEAIKRGDDEKGEKRQMME